MDKYLVLTFFDYDDILDLVAFELDDNEELSDYDQKCYESTKQDFEVFGEEIMDSEKLHRIIERMQMQRISLGQW